MMSSARLPAGIAIDTEPVHGEDLRYRTTAPVTLWPIEVENVRLSGQPIVAPANPLAAGATGVLRITLKCASPEATFAQLGVDRLRFFLRGPINQALALYELLGAHAISLPTPTTRWIPHQSSCQAVPSSPSASRRTRPCCPGRHVASPAFGCSPSISPFPRSSCSSTSRASTPKPWCPGYRLEVFVYLDRSLAELERTVGQQSLALGCTPVVNLFPQRCEPVTLSHQSTEYRIVPDARRPRAAEIWSVTRVRETLPDGSFRPRRPFHRLTEGDPEPGVPGGFYHVARRPGAPGVPGTGCSWHRTTRTSIRTSPPRPRCRSMRFASTGSAQRAAVRWRPSSPPPRRGRCSDRLVERRDRRHPHPAPADTRERLLAPRFASPLGHLSVTGGPEGAAALKEALRLYDLRDPRGPVRRSSY